MARRNNKRHDQTRLKKKPNKIIAMQDNKRRQKDKAIRPKTRQQEGRQDKTRLKQNPKESLGKGKP
jgi:hypothetical protein